ncbi:MAG: CRTAC1 family protein, partial [Bacteroidota bacterium]
VRSGDNRLLKNQGNNRFIDVAIQAGVAKAGNSRTSVFGDFNNDGWPDLYVGNFNEADVLYLNQGDGTFLDITKTAGIDSPGRAFSVNLADVDRDGLLDIYIANFQTQNILYRNLGNMQFEDITIFSRALSTYNAMGALFFDYDNDGDQDLYLTHDGQPNILYQNMGNGRYFDASRRAGVDYQGFGMGVDAADVNRDGWLDLYITNLYENVLFINNGNGKFTNVSQDAKVDDYGMAWGTNFFDYNNDGWPDIYVTNDSYFSPYPNVLYKNKGNTRFEIMSENQPVASVQGGYGSATADVDQDGRLDLLVANAASRDNLQLFNNQSEAGNWVSFALIGKESNRSAVGARIQIWDNQGRYHFDELHAGSSYASQNSSRMHFGLGTVDQIDSILIQWPNGMQQFFYDIMPNQFYEIIEGEALRPVAVTTDLTKLSIQDKISFTAQPTPATSFVEFSWQLNGRVVQPNLIQVFNLQGQEVWRKVIDSSLQASSIEWDLQQKNGANALSGIYFVKASLNGLPLGQGKLILIR